MVACRLVGSELSAGSIPAVAGGQLLAVGLAAACCGVGHAWCTACVPLVRHFANFDPYLAAAHCEKFWVVNPNSLVVPTHPKHGTTRDPACKSCAF